MSKRKNQKAETTMEAQAEGEAQATAQAIPPLTIAGLRSVVMVPRHVDHRGDWTFNQAAGKGAVVLDYDREAQVLTLSRSRVPVETGNATTARGERVPALPDDYRVESFGATIEGDRVVYRCTATDEQRAAILATLRAVFGTTRRGDERVMTSAEARAIAKAKREKSAKATAKEWTRRLEAVANTAYNAAQGDTLAETQAGAMVVGESILVVTFAQAKAEGFACAPKTLATMTRARDEAQAGGMNALRDSIDRALSIDDDEAKAIFDRLENAQAIADALVHAGEEKRRALRLGFAIVEGVDPTAHTLANVLEILPDDRARTLAERICAMDDGEAIANAIREATA